MKIKDVSTYIGLSQKAIRFYEEKGLISPSMKEVSGRYFRDYTEKDIQRLKEIALLRQAGFSIAQIQDMYQGNVSHVLKEYRLFLNQQIEEETQILEHLMPLETDDITDIIAALEHSHTEEKPMPLFHCGELEDNNVIPQSNLWYWQGIIPHRLKGISFTLTILLWQTPMTEQALINYCGHAQLKLSHKKLHRTLTRLTKAGVLKCENGIYSCIRQDWKLWEYAFTEDDIQKILTLMQNGVGDKFFYQSAAPMSVNSLSSGPK